MFLIDKVLIALLSPLGTSLALGALALALVACRRPRAAYAPGMLALLWLWLWSLPVASHRLRGQVEGPWPPVTAASLPAAQAIVVLGGGIRPPTAPDQWPDLSAAADRVWFAARLYRSAKAPIVVLSGGSNPAISVTSEARAMQVLLSDLGVPSEAIRLEERSRNTRQNAEYTAAALLPDGIHRIVLVTSALHMSRAARLFERAGFEIIPAPTDHEARHRFDAQDWLPDTDALDGSARAMKEIVGRLTGR